MGPLPLKPLIDNMFLVNFIQYPFLMFHRLGSFFKIYFYDQVVVGYMAPGTVHLPYFWANWVQGKDRRLL